MVRRLHIKENLVNLMDSKVYDNIALLGYTCTLAANDLHHIHLCAVGDKFQEIHTDAEEYMYRIQELGDFCFELAKEGGLQLYNETNALEVLKDSGNDWKVLEDNEYDFDRAYENMSDIFTNISEFIMTIQKLEGITTDVSSKLDEYLREFTKIVNYFIEKKLNNSNDILVSDTVDTTYATAESFRRNGRRTVKEANKGYSAKVYQILDDTYVSETDGKVDPDFISDNVDLYIFNDRDSYFNGIKNTRRKATSVAYDGLLNLFQVNIDDAEGKVRITSEMAKQWLKKHGIDYITLLKPVVDHIEQYREENKNESFKKNRKSVKESITYDRFEVRGYYDSNFRGLADSESFDW